MTRAMHEIQSDAMRVTQIRLLSAIEACAWVEVTKCCEALEEIAQRGRYHAAQERQQEISKFALGNYQPESESR